MQNCVTCNNAEYTNEGCFNFYYRCRITGMRYLTQQAESYCCDKYTDDLLEYCENGANSHKDIE